MYLNLRTILHRKGITIKEFAEVLDVSEKTVQNKINGASDFTYPEFRKTCNLLKEFNSDYLFTEELDPKQIA